MGQLYEDLSIAGGLFVQHLLNEWSRATPVAASPSAVPRATTTTPASAARSVELDSAVQKLVVSQSRWNKQSDHSAHTDFLNRFVKVFAPSFFVPSFLLSISCLLSGA